MHKFPLILSLATCGLLAAPAFAQDTTPNGWYVNGNVGTAHYKATVDGLGSATESDTAFILNAGYRDANILGYELGYTNLGNVSAHDDAGNHAKLSGDGWTLGLSTHLNPTDHWYISARGGMFLWKLKAKATIDDGTGPVTYRDSQQSLDWYAGVGTGYDINRHWSVGANFDYYKISGTGYDVGTKLFSVSAEYRF